MPEQIAFGRRKLGETASTLPAPARSSSCGRLVEPARLTAAAEAFRAEIKGAPAHSDFRTWNGASQRRLAAIWAVRIGLMAPGVLGFALHLPLAVSIGLEVAGLVTARWLRRERRSHRAAILAWDEVGDDRRDLP